MAIYHDAMDVISKGRMLDGLPPKPTLLALGSRLQNDETLVAVYTMIPWSSTEHKFPFTKAFEPEGQYDLDEFNSQYRNGFFTDYRFYGYKK